LEAEQEGKERTLFLTMIYFKGDKSDVTDEEVSDAVAVLREAITQGDLPDANVPDPDSN
jgi:hypothetical protein